MPRLSKITFINVFCRLQTSSNSFVTYALIQMDTHTRFRILIGPKKNQTKPVFDEIQMKAKPQELLLNSFAQEQL